MGRPRNRINAGLPDNLYAERDGGFRYRNPQTRKVTRIGSDRAAAIAAARKLNALLTSARADLVARVIGGNETIAAAVREFRAKDVPGKRWEPATAEWYEFTLTRIERDIGARELLNFGVRDAAEYLDHEAPQGGRARQVLHLVCRWLFLRAQREGWIEFNPFEVADRGTYTRKRSRLTMDAFNAIRKYADPWLQNAMDLSLATLLREADVVSARFADWHDDALWIVPQKTRRAKAPPRIVIVDAGLNLSLATIISRCRDDTLSPYLVHRRPARLAPAHKRAKGRVHHTQILPEQVVREFAKARAAAVDAGDLPASEHPPTFHEIRSLGAAELRLAGWTKEQVQALLTHASESMTRIYLDGHEQPWTRVQGGPLAP